MFFEVRENRGLLACYRKSSEIRKGAARGFNSTRAVYWRLANSVLFIFVRPVSHSSRFPSLISLSRCFPRQKQSRLRYNMAPLWLSIVFPHLSVRTQCREPYSTVFSWYVGVC